MFDPESEAKILYIPFSSCRFCMFSWLAALNALLKALSGRLIHKHANLYIGTGQMKAHRNTDKLAAQVCCLHVGVFLTYRAIIRVTRALTRSFRG
ncbi:hypothetical protein BC826DRAFT_115686 [Russula brevipes]|nr:hypothetical protein BC826DRAFT_115686 [Russula brevipes]